MVLKTMLFCHRFFIAFFRFFAILARFWEAPEAQKINKKSKNHVGDGFGTRLGSSIDFGHDLEVILWILDEL